MRRTSWVLLVAAGALLLAAAFAHAKDPELPSTFRRAGVTVDGVADEWQGKLVPVGDAPVVVGVMNDASFVYVCVKTSDDATRKKILFLGLSLYLDRSGKEDRAFGVRFPVGRRGRPDVPDVEDTQTAAALEVSAAGALIDLLGKEEADVGRMRVAEVKPLEAALGDAGGALVIELKVPLAFSIETPHAIESAPGRTIALGLETAEPKLKRSGPREGSGGGGMRGGGMRGGGGMGGGGRGMGGGGFGRGRGGGREARNEAEAFGKPLKLWLQVPLATEAR